MLWLRGSTKPPELLSLGNSPPTQECSRSGSCDGRPERWAKARALANDRVTSRNARLNEYWSNPAHSSARKRRLETMFHVKRDVDTTGPDGTSSL